MHRWRVGVGLLSAALVVLHAESNSAASTAYQIEGRSYELKLRTLVIPAPPAIGLFLEARINSGPTLRLLLDSGAQYITLDKRAAAKSGYFSGSELDLVGVGDSAKTAKITRASTVTIGDLELRNRGLIILDQKLLDGVDGVMPLSAFSSFLITLDIPRKTLDLEPYLPDRALDSSDVERVQGSQDLLFLKGVINDSTEGYILLDTGAFYNAISEPTANALRFPRLLSSSVPLRGGSGALEGRMYSSEVRFRFGSSVLVTNQVVVLPLQQFERYHRIEVAGVLGFPALRNSVLRIDYRNELVRIAGR